MPLLQFGCTPTDLTQAQWDLLAALADTLEHAAYAPAGQARLRALVANIKSAATPTAWLHTFLDRLAQTWETLLTTNAALQTEVTTLRTARSQAEQAAQTHQYQHTIQQAQLADCQQRLAITNDWVETLTAQYNTLVDEWEALTQAEAAARARVTALEQAQAAHQALIVKLREELKARA